MPRTAIALILTAAATISATTKASAEPNKEQYELQERCGKRAAEMFKSDYPRGRESGTATVNTEDGTDIITYENHYSAALNKCFYLQITTTTKKKPPISATTIMNLFDINENKQYGTFFGISDRPPALCELQQKVCHSESEWRELLRPYMEE
jgi:hypothetical protein